MLSTHFAAELQEALNYKTAEVKTLKDQLTLLDIKIDRYDTIIQNIDKKLIPLIDEINVSISSVKTAYDNRIAAKCRSNLYWEKTVTNTFFNFFGFNYEDPRYTITTYTCKKNPNVRVNEGYYGAKYYRKPQNQDYGANIVREFYGSIGAGGTTLAIFGVDGTTNLVVGDFIVDNIDDPKVFNPNNLPRIVGFATTSIVKSTIDFEGSASIGSTIIGSVGVGSTGQINIGDSISFTGILQPNTRVVGFGTTTITLNNFWDPGSGSFISTTAITNGIIVSIPASSTVTGTFKVGALETYPGLVLSVPANLSATNTNFTDIRDTQTSYTKFDYTNNPLDPVTVGIMENNTVGYGHKIVKVNNGFPPGPYQWREIMVSSFANKADYELNDGERYLREKYPEPNCGANNAEYYPGNTSWPIKITNLYDDMGVLLSSSSTYASEGDSVVVSGGSTSLYGIGYTGGKPPGAASNADCANIYDVGIAVAEASRNAILARNGPQIDSLIASSAALRELRDILETRAFSLLQGRISGDVEVNNLTEKLKIIQSTDFSPFEPKNYYYNSEEGKFNSSTLGIATV